MEDRLPTLLAAAEEPNIAEKLLKGHKAGGRTFKVHIDGYNFLPYFTGKAEKGPRKEMFQFTDHGSLSALRYEDWKLMFSIQEAHGMDVWLRPYITLRAPYLFNLRMDPFERADHEGTDYERWFAEHMSIFVPAQAFVAKFLKTLKEYPPSQRQAKFNVEDVMRILQEVQT